MLPNGDKAVVTNEKLFDFLLNEDHPSQPGHAVLFRTLLGITRENADSLRSALLAAAATMAAIPGRPTPHGEKYEIRFEMTGPKGTYTILSVWMIEHGQVIPRLITAFVE